MLLIGSCAIQHHIPSWRNPLDVDLVGTYEEIEALRKAKGNSVTAFYPINSGASFYLKQKDGLITEAEVAWAGSRAEKLIDFVMQESDTICLEVGKLYVPSLDVLYMLKMSHRYLKNSPHFKKTLDDVLALRKLGAKIRPEHQQFYEQRMRDTYVNKLPKLNVNKDEFFSGDGIEYEFQHDDLHEAVKFMDVPAYTLYAGGEVWSDMNKFKQCSREVQLYGILEEALTLAAERSQLCFTPRPDPDWSFKYALSKVSSSITGGVFREAAWEAYYDVVELYEREGKGYMNKVDKAIEQGLVRRTKQLEAA
jgi:hypothetical protein